MKRKSFITLLVILVCLPSFAQLDKLKSLSQDDPEIVKDIGPDVVWQIVEKVLRDKGYKLGEIKLEEKMIYSDWIEWTSLAIKKRARISFTYKEPDLEILVSDRQYSSTEGWADALGKLAKATRKEYMEEFAKLVREIKDDPEKTKDAILNSVLFPVFKPLHQQGDFQWNLCRTFRNEKEEVFLDFEVVNQGKKLTSLDIPSCELYLKTSGTSSNGSAGLKWEKYVDMPRKTQFKPGDTIMLQAKVGSIYHWNREDIPMLILKNFYNDGREESKLLKIYKIPIPYTNPEF